MASQVNGQTHMNIIINLASKYYQKSPEIPEIINNFINKITFNFLAPCRGATKTPP